MAQCVLYYVRKLLVDALMFTPSIIFSSDKSEQTVDGSDRRARNEASPSGKATGFDSVMRWFESSHLSQRH